jgi:DNA-directed RNA polymerase alpha subunit
MRHHYELCSGPIDGLQLSFATWKALSRENITTLNQLRAAADQIEQVPGIGPWSARMIRAELSRIASPVGH